MSPPWLDISVHKCRCLEREPYKVFDLNQTFLPSLFVSSLLLKFNLPLLQMKRFVSEKEKEKNPSILLWIKTNLPPSNLFVPIKRFVSVLSCHYKNINYASLFIMSRVVQTPQQMHGLWAVS